MVLTADEAEHTDASTSEEAKVLPSGTRMEGLEADTNGKD